MDVVEELPYVFDAMEIEFDHFPSIRRRIEIVQSLEQLFDGHWLVEQIFDDRNIFLLETDALSISSDVAFNIAATLLESDDILYACPNFDYSEIDSEWNFDELDAEFDDSYVSTVALNNTEWHLDQIKAKEAWNLPLPSDGAALGAGVVIGHIDTGYTEHYEYYADADINVESGYNFLEINPSALEPLKTIKKGHGGATGSVLVSQQGPSTSNPGTEFVSGISPKSTLIPIRVDKNVWFLSPKRDVKGIKHAIAQGCHIISMSRSGLGSRSFEEIAEKARKRGIIIVAAAGNCVPGCGIEAPAKYVSVICAGGTTADEQPWGRTSRGPEVDICAPAHHVWRARTTEVNNDYSFDVGPSSGTSYATPLVAGAAALWIAFHGGHARLAQKLGGIENIPTAFQQLLKGPGASKPKGSWNTGLYGSGILDVVGLLTADLPNLHTDELKIYAATPVIVKNPHRIDFLDSISSNQDKKFRRLLEDEFDFLLLTNFSISKLYDRYSLDEISIDDFSAQFNSLLAERSVSLLLRQSLG